MSTAVDTDPCLLIELYMKRWGIEVLFEESRAHMGIETQRQFSDNAVAKTTPLIFSLYTLVLIRGHLTTFEQKIEPQKSAWYKKEHITFSDILGVVRMEILKCNDYFKSDLPPDVMNCGLYEGSPFLQRLQELVT